MKKTITALSAVFLAFFPLFSPAVFAQNISLPQNHFVVKLKGVQSLEKLLKLDEQAKPLFAQASDPKFFQIYSFKSQISETGLTNYFANDADYVLPDYKVSGQTVVLNDPGFTLNALDNQRQWGLARAGFPEVWQKTTGSKSNVVSVIDTGVDVTHEDLRTVDFKIGYDFTTNKPIPAFTNSDDNGHGTMVAGILGATANNNMGVAGTNWEISILPVKALDKDGKGESSTVAEAIVWSADHGANIINLSLGGIGEGYNTLLGDAIEYAFNKNIVIVAAAGNDVEINGGNLDSNPVFPICDDNKGNMVIGVTAVDWNDQKPSFANYSKNCIDVSAPGKKILSTINIDPFNKNPSPNTYAYASGTSMAVPFVSGLAALIKSLHPTATNIQIRDQISKYSDNIDDYNTTQCGGGLCKGMLGMGRINAKKALDNPLVAKAISEGDLLMEAETGTVFYIQTGQKRVVSDFVLKQRFFNEKPRELPAVNLQDLPLGSYMPPLDGSLIMSDIEPTVYIMKNGVRNPLTLQVFKHYDFEFKNVFVLPQEQVSSWPKGEFFAPKEGTLVRATKNKNLYWVVGGALHLTNNGFYQDRGLKIFPVLMVADKDISGFAKGENYFK